MLTLDMRTQTKKILSALYFATVLLCCLCAEEEMKAVKVREGATVTFKMRESRQNNAQVVWTYGQETPNQRVARVTGKVRSDYDGHFGGRLQLDVQTGDLTITELKVNDSGVFRCQIIERNILAQNFHLTVYGSVAPPSIKLNTSLINTSCSTVMVECCVNNSRELTLSWYRGGDILKNMSLPDPSSMLSLALEIKSDDGDEFSCVAKNPVEEKSIKLHTKDTCLRGGEANSWCRTESTVRLAVSALVGLALMVILVDHIRLRR